MRKKWLLFIPLILVIIYFAGPSPATPAYNKEMPTVPSDPAELEAYVRANEAAHKLKPDNQARIVWAGEANNGVETSDSADSANIIGSPAGGWPKTGASSRRVTDYSIVYLHGFTASQGEGDPVHRNIARKFGCNLYLSRLAEHGIDTADAMMNLTADELWQSAKQALAIGTQLGKKVILIGTSTGGTEALQLAAAYPGKVAALILLSPNIAINDPNAWLLNNHWGLQIARLVVGSNYIDSKQDFGPLYRRYWYPHYRAEGAVALQELLETTMNKETFEKVEQPVELLYYYKDKIHQDSTVKVSAMLKMFDELGTPPGLKYKQAIPEAGTHVIGSTIRSHDVEGVEKAIEKFMTEVIHLKPADSSSLAGGAHSSLGMPAHSK